MRTKLRFKSLRSRMSFWLTIVALTPLITVSAVIYQQRVAAIKVEAFRKLTAIRDLKVHQLNHWFDERIGDVRTLSEDASIREFGETFGSKALTEDTSNLTRTVTSQLERYVRNYDTYHEVFILNADTGNVEISSDRTSIGLDKSKDLYYTEPLKSGQLYIRDIYYSKTLRLPSMAFSAPIYSVAEDSRISGILVVRIDLSQSLYGDLMNRTGMGTTGETLIVNKDLFAINELRWRENAPLRLPIRAKPAVMASRGDVGIVEAEDYRNVRVLAAYTYIPKTKWGLVSKQDLSEVYSPIQSMLNRILLLLLGSAAAVYLLALFLSKTISRPVLEMTKVAGEIEAGDLSARNHVTATDELGYLANAFNDMADSVQSQALIQNSSADITRTMVEAGQLEDFSRMLLNDLVDATDSNLGTCYLYSADNKRFECLYSIGATVDLLEPFDAETLEGEFGKALSTKHISHIKDIPEDTHFRFKTIAGTLLPKEIITLPIIVRNQIMAVISLANLEPYSDESIAVLEQIWLSINTVLSNLMANVETQRLADELGDKNQELKAQTEELQAMNEEVQGQAEELQEQNTELEAQRQQVEDANRLKSEFLSNMSHELRTPLNSVMALSRVLLIQAKEKLSDEEVNFLEIIERNGKQLLALINDILDLSKIEAGKMDISPKAFSIGLTIETIAESLGPLAEEKGVGIILSIPEDLPRIESDESRVHQILQNIIGNGVKFTHQGNVKVSALRDAEKVIISVEDTGIGISGKDLPHIFDEFRQVDGSSARMFEGTGLGLAIAYKAVKILGGGISVESTPGKGTTFGITLPIAWGGPAELYEPIPAGPSSETIRQGQKTILVVDDEPDVVEMISAYLSDEGYDTIAATSGKEALRIAETHPPFAITLDVTMPEMDGWETLQNLKKNPVTADIPVIIVTVSEDRGTGFALGAVGFISKPFTSNALIAEINKIGMQQPHSIMVVDDNEIDLKQTARVIEAEGIEAVLADSGSTCMEMLKANLPDLLVLDLMMPGMDGFEVLDRIRMSPETSDLPVIIVSAKDLTAEERKRLEGSVSSILAKSDTTSTSLLEEIKKTLVGIERQAKRPEGERSEGGKRILLVEDNEASVIQVKHTLESEGFIVDVAGDGEEALAYVKETIPDGIILDLMMPGVDGFEVLDEIRNTEATIRIPVLILTAKDLTPDDLRRLRSNNIQELLQKGDVDREGLLLKTKTMMGMVTGEKADDPDQEKTGPATRKGAGPAPVRRKGVPTILIVEDNPDNMITIKAVLGDRYEIREATDGETGLEMALVELPDLVLLDMSLPGMDGFEVVGKIKADEKARHIPVIALTAKAMKGDREQIMAAGCDDYISKPVDPEKITKTIDAWIAKGPGGEDPLT